MSSCRLSQLISCRNAALFVSLADQWLGLRSPDKPFAAWGFKPSTEAQQLVPRLRCLILHCKCVATCVNTAFEQSDLVIWITPWIQRYADRPTFYRIDYGFVSLDNRLSNTIEGRTRRSGCTNVSRCPSPVPLSHPASSYQIWKLSNAPIITRKRHIWLKYTVHVV